MQVQAAWLKPGVWGAIIGSVATMIIGFSWLGWTLGSTAERAAQQRTESAMTETGRICRKGRLGHYGGKQRAYTGSCERVCPGALEDEELGLMA